MDKINSEILVWARETASLSLEEAAKKLGIKDTRSLNAGDRLAALENGSEKPNRALLVKMAKQYNRSLLTFYLAQPPKKGNRGQDFRTLPENYSDENSALLDALLRDIITRQNLVLSALEEEEAKSLDFISSARMSDGIQKLVTSITRTLDLDIKEFRNHQKPEKAFEFLRTKAEDAGIFVLLIGNLGSHHSAISVESFRGFALADPIAPFVIINDQDAKTAWSFTLLHEIVHLWLGESGVSGNYAELKIEQFCNDVAAEILFPLNEIVDLKVSSSTDAASLIAAISNFAKSNNLSHTMVAYRLFRHNVIDEAKWDYLQKFFREEWKKGKEKQKDKSKKSGPDYYTVRRQRLGKALIDFVSRTINDGILTPTKAGKVLGIKSTNVETLIHPPVTTPILGGRS